MPGSPAEGAGIRTGDVVTTVDGHAVASATALHDAMSNHKPGDRVRVAWTDSNGTSTPPTSAWPPARSADRPFPERGPRRDHDRPAPRTHLRHPHPTCPGADHAALLADALFQVKKVIVGQDRLVERVMLCLLADGHCLIEGFPGLAKNADRVDDGAAVAATSPGSLRPTSCRPTSLGTRTWRPSRADFAVGGAALREHRARGRDRPRPATVSVGACSRRSPSGTCRSRGRPAALPRPFLVLATQNPIESEGVYALPEAQRDRFLMHVVVQHPTYEEEVAIAHRMSGPTPHAEQVLTSEQLVELQGVVRDVFVHHAVQDYAVRLVMAEILPSPPPSGKRERGKGRAP